MSPLKLFSSVLFANNISPLNIHHSEFSPSRCQTKPKVPNRFFCEVVPQLRRLIAGFPPLCHGLDPRSGHAGFVVGKMALGLVFSESFRFSCQLSFHQLTDTH
jgi:hypothetical protein